MLETLALQARLSSVLLNNDLLNNDLLNYFPRKPILIRRFRERNAEIRTTKTNNLKIKGHNIGRNGKQASLRQSSVSQLPVKSE